MNHLYSSNNIVYTSVYMSLEYHRYNITMLGVSNHWYTLAIIIILC